MWKKIVMGVLLVASGVVGFFAAKAQVTFNSTMM